MTFTLSLYVYRFISAITLLGTPAEVYSKGENSFTDSCRMKLCCALSVILRQCLQIIYRVYFLFLIWNPGSLYWMIGIAYIFVMAAAAFIYLPVFYDLQLTSAYEVSTCLLLTFKVFKIFIKMSLRRKIYIWLSPQLLDLQDSGSCFCKNHRRVLYLKWYGYIQPVWWHHNCNCNPADFQILIGFKTIIVLLYQ